MTSLSTINNLLNVQPPSYYSLSHIDTSNNNINFLSVRIFYVVLPFIALHKPFGTSITLVMHSKRTYVSFFKLVENQDLRELLKTTIALSALVCTFFMHPLGLCISTLHDLGYDLTTVIAQLQMGQNQQAFYSLFLAAQNLFYLGNIIVGSVEIIVLSTLLSMIVEICTSKTEFQKGNILEGVSHLLMSIVRFSQAIPYIEKTAYKHNIQGKEYSKNLTETMAKIRDSIAIVFFSSGRFFISPLWKITDNWMETISLFQNDESSTAQKVLSSGKSVFFSLALLPFALGGLMAGQVAHFSAYLISTTPYIHLKNDIEVKGKDKSLSLFQLNCCLPSGGFSRLFGGTVTPNDERVLQIVDMIQKNNPDLVCLQEVSDLNDAFKLYNELSSEYSDFYLNMGATPFILQNNSGLFVASKVAIERPELHSFSDIEGVESMVNKCYFLFSTDTANFINTHLSPSHGDLNPTDAEIHTRALEQERIITAAYQRSSEHNTPTYVLGDFNINWNSKEYQESSLFTEGFDQYNLNRLVVSDQEATAETDYLIDCNWHHKKNAKLQRLILDYFLSFSCSDQSNIIYTRKVSTFDIDHPERAISDHAALVTTIEQRLD